MAESVNLEALIDQVQGRRRQLLVGVVGTGLLGLGTAVGPFMGSMMVSLLVSGSPLTGGPVVDLGLSETQLVSLVGFGSLLVSGPLCLAMLWGSWIWHRLVRDEAIAAGVETPAVGIAAPARLIAIPGIVGLVLTGLLVPLVFVLPTPDSSDILGNALAGAAILAPLLGPLIALLIAWRRGFDSEGTRRYRRGELALDDLPAEPLAAFPMIARRPRSLVRAELLLEAGRLDEADALVRRYLETVGVSLHRALILWSRVHRAAGRHQQAEEALAAAARLVPVDATPFRELAGLRRDRGLAADADRLEAEAAVLAGGLFRLRSA